MCTHILSKNMNVLLYMCLMVPLHWPAKKLPTMKFQYSVRFSPAEYKYENQFFPSRLDFPKKYEKDVKVNRLGCFKLCLC